MLYLTIIDKQNNLKFSAKGNKICETYIGEFYEGDRISIRLDGTNTLAVKLDEMVQESFIYCPNKSFTFHIIIH